MRLAKVVGTAVSTVKQGALGGSKLLLCQGCSPAGEESGEHFVALDAVGAGGGEIVMVATGSAARATDRTANAPVDATVVGIVDAIHLDGRMTYSRNERT